MSAYGYDSVTIALYRYRPASARSLAVLAGADSKGDAARRDSADLLRMVAMASPPGDATIPTLGEIFRPRPAEMSKAEIKKALIDRLMGSPNKGDMT